MRDVSLLFTEVNSAVRQCFIEMIKQYEADEKCTKPCEFCNNERAAVLSDLIAWLKFNTVKAKPWKCFNMWETCPDSNCALKADCKQHFDKPANEFPELPVASTSDTTDSPLFKLLVWCDYAQKRIQELERRLKC